VRHCLQHLFTKPFPEFNNPFLVTGWTEIVDMTEAVEYLKGKNVDVTVAPMDLGDSLRAEITDPDGFMIELRQWK